MKRGGQAGGFEFDAAVLPLLACPACLGALELDPANLDGMARLACEGCGRRYPIVEGIPVLIVERAELPGQTVSSIDTSASATGKLGE